jgi:hypothetical protein
MSTTQLLDWCYARKRLFGERISDGHRWSVRRVCRVLCVPIGRAKTIGRPILWRLRDIDSGRNNY